MAIKLTIEWKRKNTCHVFLDGQKCFDSLENMMEAGLFKGVFAIWVWCPDADALWRYELPEK